jgi:hypothetical protein
MWRVTLLRVALVISLVPIPALVLSLLLLTIDSALGKTPLGDISTALLWVVGVAYLLSMAATMFAGVVWGSRLLLLPPVTSVIDLGLFAVFLPPGDSAVGWRTIDAVLLSLLCLLNVVQIMLLRRHLRSLSQEIPDEIDGVGHSSLSYDR